MPRARHLLHVVIALLLAAAGLIGPGAAPCSACSCAAPTDLAADVANADAVFTGTVEVQAPTTDGPTIASSDPVYFAVRVDRVYAGDVAARATVVTARDGAACGADLAAGRDYIFLARAEGHSWRVGLCGGTLPAADVARVAALTGAGHAPTVTSAPPSSPRSSADGTGNRLADAIGWPAPLIVGPLALGILALAWFARRGRRARAGRRGTGGG